MFSSGPNYTKLKTNLRLAQNRLKLLEKKKAELAQKARKEIADYLATGKTERARIRVEHIIREDYLVEAMEIIEMYCDLLLARFGLITQMKELDDGIAEPVSSLVWVCPRLQSDVIELKVIADIFMHKYGPQFAEQARTATGEHHVSEKLMHKLQIQAPPKLLVEKYLVEIAKIYNVEYEPDPQVMKDESKDGDHFLIDLSDKNNLNGGGGGGAGGGSAPPHIGFVGYPSVPPLPVMPDPPLHKPFNYPPHFGGGGGGGGGAAANIGSGSAPSNFAYNIPPTVVQPATPPAAQTPYAGEQKDLNTNFINRQKMHNDPPPRYSSINPLNFQNSNKPKPQPRSKLPNATDPSAPPVLPELPNVPSEMPDIPQYHIDNNTKQAGNEDDIDFDDLSRRFENLKKRK